MGLSKKKNSISHNEEDTAMIVETKKKELQEELEAISRDFGIDAVFTLIADPTNNYKNTVISSSSSSSSAAAVEEEFPMPNVDNFSEEELSELLVQVEEKKKIVAAKITEIKKKKRNKS